MPRGIIKFTNSYIFVPIRQRDALYALVAVVAAERGVLRMGLRDAGLLWIVAGSAVVCLVAAVALWKGGRGGVVPTLCAVWVALAAGAGLAGIAYAEGASLETALESRPVSSFEFEVTGEMSEGRDGWRGRALARGDGTPGGSVWILTDEEIHEGATISCVGRYAPDAEDELYANDNETRYQIMDDHIT